MGQERIGEPVGAGVVFDGGFRHHPLALRTQFGRQFKDIPQGFDAGFRGCDGELQLGFPLVVDPDRRGISMARLTFARSKNELPLTRMPYLNGFRMVPVIPKTIQIRIAQG